MTTNEDMDQNTLVQDKTEKASIQQENTTNIPIQPNVEAKETTETKEDPNWKAFREARKKDRMEKEAAERLAQQKSAEAAALKAAMEAAFAKESRAHTNTDHSSHTYYEEEIEDERIEKKLQSLLAKREAEAEKQRQERERNEYPQRLQQTYPDFNHIISDTNLDYLEYHYPEVAAPLKRLPDNFDKWSDIYRAIKKFVPNNEHSSRDVSRAQANFSKPKSISSTGMTQIGESQPTRLSDDRKAANWERMQRTLKGII